MKKFVFLASIVASFMVMTFASCDCGKCEAAANDSDSVVAVVDSTVVDTLVEVADSVVAE